VYSRLSVSMSFLRLAPSVTPFSFNWLDRVMAWPLWLMAISTAMSFCGPLMPTCTP
jgi:hypothetical protein